MKISVRMPGVPAEIRSEHLQNTSPEHYHYTNLLRNMLYCDNEEYIICPVIVYILYLGS
jgi:hypothetical protein